MGHGLPLRATPAAAAVSVRGRLVGAGIPEAVSGPLVAVAYFATAQLGLRFAATFDAVTLVWPPAGIALVALFVSRGRLWPWVAAGSLAVDVHVGLGLATSSLIAAGNTLAAWWGARCLRRFGFRPSLCRIRDVGLLLGIGCVGTVAISASVGAAALGAGGFVSKTELASAWSLWWLGDGLGVLFLSPLLLTVGERLGAGRPRRPRWQVLLPTVATLVVVSALFFTWEVDPGPHYLFLLAPMPLMIWVAGRCGPRGVSYLTFVLVAGGTALTAQGLGPFATPVPESGLLMLEGYVGGTAVVGFLLAAARAEERLLASRLEQAAAVFDHAGEGIVITDAEGRVKLANAAFWHLCGPAGELHGGLSVDDVRLGGEQAVDFRGLLDRLAAGESATGEARYRRGGRDSFAAWESWIALPDPADLGGSVIGTVSDISRLKSYAHRLAHEARHDHLTGLMNRRTFHQALERELQQSRRHGHRLGLLFIDLDRFKLINDTLGHQAGDQLLVQVGERLRTCVRAEDAVARLGGDEFTVLLTEVDGEEGVLHAARQVAEALEEPLRLAGERIVVQPSIGAACYPRDAVDSEGLLRAADDAMFRAKACRTGAIRAAWETADADAEAERPDPERVGAALDSGRVELAYQPVVDGRDGSVAGLEALISARQAAQSAGLSPSAFVGMAERSGRCAALTRQVLERLREDVEEWRSAGLTVPPLSVNLPGRLVLGDPGLELLRELVLRFREDCGDVELTLELPETALWSVHHSKEPLEALRATGVRLVLDGFGRGSSRPCELQDAPLDGIKLDRSLIAGLPAGEPETTLCRCFLQLAGSFGFRVAAVGVETEAQRRFLVELGCPLMQGRLFQGPEDAAATAALLRDAALPAARFATVAQGPARSSVEPGPGQR